MTGNCRKGSKLLFCICLPSERSAVGSWDSFLPLQAQGTHFPKTANYFLVFISSFSNSAFTTFDLGRNRCVGTLEVTVASLQRERPLSAGPNDSG